MEQLVSPVSKTIVTSDCHGLSQVGRGHSQNVWNTLDISGESSKSATSPLLMSGTFERIFHCEPWDAADLSPIGGIVHLASFIVLKRVDLTGDGAIHVILLLVQDDGELMVEEFEGRSISNYKFGSIVNGWNGEN